MKIFASTTALLLACCCQLLNSMVEASVVPPRGNENEPQCIGLHIDFDRFTDVKPDDINTAAPNPQAMFGTRDYGVNNIMEVTDSVTSECKFQRHRLQEKYQGVSVLGAELIVTIEECTPQDDQMAFGDQQPLANVEMNTISKLEGKTFTLIEEKNGYTANRTESEAREALAEYYQTSTEKIGELSTIIFPSYEQGDFLAYRGEVWVSDDGDVQLYDVFISAHTLEILQSCKKINSQRTVQWQNRNLRQQKQQQLERENNHQHRSLDVCSSCASQARVTWTDDEVECPINSLYLNDDSRTATCLKGTLNGVEVLGPGTVAALHYGGTYDCNGSERVCNANELPMGCSDALSDVHYGMLQSLKFYQEYLGVMGGLKVSANNPVPFNSFVHFGNRYCNAFFTTQTNSLYFGDCDCSQWGPLTSIDVAAHELTHGITSFSSQLIYSHQPGGLNEGYSDIMGTTMEFYLNDSNDIPDFDLGENLVNNDMTGSILRFMENPSQDGNSIENVCDFQSDMPVHYTSGVLNKAFTSAARSCEANSCSGDLRECVLLLGPLFMYANIHKLTSLSGYMDSASQTCGVIEEFYSARSPSSSCSAAQAKEFVTAGWAAVGVAIDSSCQASSLNGCVVSNVPANAGSNALSLMARIYAALLNILRWMSQQFED